jgi:hypothetical protein
MILCLSAYLDLVILYPMYLDPLHDVPLAGFRIASTDNGVCVV